jgi:hypothetical protein
METLNQKIELYNKNRHKLPEGETRIGTLKEMFNGGEIVIAGKVGRNGTKIHGFAADYIILNDVKVVISYNSNCGTETYKSAVCVVPFGTPVTCEKCLNKINH